MPQRRPARVHHPRAHGHHRVQLMEEMPPARRTPDSEQLSAGDVRLVQGSGHTSWRPASAVGCLRALHVGYYSSSTFAAYLQCHSIKQENILTKAFRIFHRKQKKSINLGKINKELSGRAHDRAGHTYVYFDLTRDPSHDWKETFLSLASRPVAATSYSFDTRGTPGMASEYLVALVPDQTLDMKALKSETERFVAEANETYRWAIEQRQERNDQQARRRTAERQSFERAVDHANGRRRSQIGAMVIGGAVVIGVAWLFL